MRNGWNGPVATVARDRPAEEFGDYFVLLLFPLRFMDLYWFSCTDGCVCHQVH